VNFAQKKPKIWLKSYCKDKRKRGVLCGKKPTKTGNFENKKATKKARKFRAFLFVILSHH